MFIKFIFQQKGTENILMHLDSNDLFNQNKSNASYILQRRFFLKDVTIFFTFKFLI